MIDTYFVQHDFDAGTEFYGLKNDDHVLIMDGRHDIPEIIVLAQINEHDNILVFGSDPEQEPVIDTFVDTTELSGLKVYKKIK
jgi:hypothetical protein